MLKAVQKKDKGEVVIQLMFWVSLAILIGCQIGVYIPIRLFIYISDFRLHRIAYLLLIIRIVFLAEYNWKHLAGVTAVLLPLVYVASLTNNEIPFVATVLTIIAARGIDYKEIAAFMTAFSLFVLVVAIGLTATGYLSDNIFIRTTMLGTEVTRHSFGFPHPNSFAAWVMVLSSSVMQWMHGKFKWWQLGLIVAVNLLVYYFTNSRAAIICIFILIVGEIISVRMERRTINAKKVAVAIAALIVLVIAGSYLLMVIYNDNNSAMKLLNRLFSDRLKWSHLAYLQNGVSVFGQTIVFSEPLDSLYIRLILEDGVVITVVFCMIKLISAIRASRLGAYYIAFACIAVLAYNTMESMMLFLWNLPVFALTATINTDKKGKLVEDEGSQIQ